MTQNNLFTPEEYKRNFAKNKKAKKEEKVQVLVCDYIRAKYPDVIFQCDLASGLKLPIWISAAHKKMRSSRGMPDLFIAKPKHIYHGYPIPIGEDDNCIAKTFNGLFIELKRDGVKIFKRDGELVADEHIREQAAILERLRNNGYAAEFACGFEQAIKIIDQYLSG